jgi:hypothetical protein
LKLVDPLSSKNKPAGESKTRGLIREASSYNSLPDHAIALTSQSSRTESQSNLRTKTPIGPWKMVTDAATRCHQSSTAARANKAINLVRKAEKTQ